MAVNGGRAVVTGADGYLGSRIATALSGRGWDVARLVHHPHQGAASEFTFVLGEPVDPSHVHCDVLIHAAYDFSVRRRADIARVNVDGTHKLLDAVGRAGVPRVIVLSTMSAYQGTTQQYGLAKLKIEALTAAVGGTSVRPGLVYGRNAGGMFGALTRMVRLPAIPLIAPGTRQFPVHEDDLIDAIVALATTSDAIPSPVGIAQPTPVTFREILETIAAVEGRSPRYIPVPWQVVYAGLRSAEALGLRPPFRADSLLGLVRPAAVVPHPEVLERLGVSLRPFSAATLAQ
jgi:nucleoside-diphosphate-sugar epimerase